MDVSEFCEKACISRVVSGENRVREDTFLLESDFLSQEC